jgi:hypothetical protein
MKSAAVWAVVFLGIVYCAVGIVFGLLAGQAESNQGLVAWRWAAWVVSAIVFGAHIVFEQLRLGSSPRITALHVSCAAGLGAFGLAVAAVLHGLTVAPYRPSLLVVLSLAIWPVMTALSAFLVALVAAVLFARVWRTFRPVRMLPDHR